MFSIITCGTLSIVSLVHLASLFQWSYAFSVLIAIGEPSVSNFCGDIRSVGGHRRDM